MAWCECVSSCQECFGEGAAVAVPARWAVSIFKVAIRIAIDASLFMLMSCPPNVGPYEEKKYMEYALR